jgi:structural maintenance of chromosome 1
MQPKFQERQVALEKTSALAKEYQDAVSEVQDKIFSAFCKRLGYADIRAYEAQQGSLEQEAAEKKNAFEQQKQRLGSQLKWDASQIKDTEGRINRLKARIHQLEQDIEKYNVEKTELENAADTLRAEQTVLEDELQKSKEKLLAKNEKVNQAKSELQKRSKEIDTRTKAITALETEAQRSSAGRYALLRRCKLEQITIPLSERSRKLDTLPVDDNVLRTDPDAMEVDEDEDGAGAQEVIKDYGIEINFEDLDDELKAVSYATATR